MVRLSLRRCKNCGEGLSVMDVNCRSCGSDVAMDEWRYALGVIGATIVVILFLYQGIQAIGVLSVSYVIGEFAFAGLFLASGLYCAIMWRKVH